MFVFVFDGVVIFMLSCVNPHKEAKVIIHAQEMKEERKTDYNLPLKVMKYIIIVIGLKITKTAV